jgi:mevalonate kinase
MTLNFSAPSKTFLAGEYAVLAGGPGLLLDTAPRFSFQAVKGVGGVEGIPDGSPAAKWLKSHENLTRDWKLEFLDPHTGRGGFGASSAQFLFAHAWTSLMQISVSRAVEGIDLKALWSDFKSASGGMASGADMLAQAVGGVAVVSGSEAESRSWPFPDLDFAILRTGQKVETHRHLAELDRGVLQTLVGPANQVVDRFQAGSVEKFLHAVKDYALQLRELHLQAPSTLAFLKTLENEPWCKAAKGCGALGADTLLVFFAREDAGVALRFMQDQKLEWVSGAADLSEGLQMKWDWQ